MRDLVVLIGLPGSGKSTFAASLLKAGWTSFSSDAIREELGLDPTKKEDHQKCFSVMDDRVVKALSQGQDVIYDATNLSRKKRMNLVQKLSRIALNKSCMVFITPVEECKVRDAARPKPVGEAVIDRMLGNFEPPWVYEGWNQIGFYPNSPACTYTYPKEDIDQKNPHHQLGLKSHMIKAERFAIDNKFNDNVIMAARYHDLGKYVTQSFDKEGVAHYYSHHNAGAYLFLSGFTMPTPTDLYIANLIGWHMAPFMQWKSKEAEMKDREMMGLQMYLDIMNLHQADVAAH